MSAQSSLRSIGQVLASLRGEFADVSISKIRFLETAGLLAPQRAASGYRRYSTEDVDRLRYILSVQRDHYLPLKVIREHLEMMDRGMTPPIVDSIRPVPGQGTGNAPVNGSPPESSRSGSAQPQATQGQPQSTSAQPQGSQAQSPGPQQPPAQLPPRPLRLSRQDLLEASGLTEPALADLERTQIVVPKRGTPFYGREALTLATAARRLAEYGIDSRHLRAFKMSADREVGLVEQAIAPHVRRAGGNRDVSGEVTQLVISFHAALVRTAMER
jgi:DNA-binding transcriptional MerR regulator